MDKDTTYAVVDIETTGTSVKDGDRVIQIGCAFVKHGKVVNQYSTKINPGKSIPNAITHLTSITNRDVANAPFFDDIAASFYAMLQGTVFVAHNVNFDFPFLNAEFARVGYPALQIEAIDTVTLTQILFPTLPSFRLRDLSAHFHIEHDQPHTADSDADATAVLLIKLLDKLHQLPINTLRQLTNLNLSLPQDTTAVFNVALEEARHHPSKLPAGEYVRDRLVLHEATPIKSVDLGQPQAYPKSKAAKQKLWGSKISWRDPQAKMMNQIFSNYSHENTKNLIIEAPTGIGKTLGYAVPFAYLSQTGQSTVISTQTTLLQGQFMQETLPQLQEMLPFDLNVVTVKGNQHYLDLNRFADTLTVPEHSQQSQFLKARILVWLLQTETGDLDELHLTSYRAQLFEEVCHRGLKTIKPSDPFYEDDYLRRLDHRIRQANLVIVNHAYLTQHADQLDTLLNKPYLLVDEAQHLPDVAVNQHRNTVRFHDLVLLLHHAQANIFNQHDHHLTEMFSEDAVAATQLRSLSNTLIKLDADLDQFGHSMYRQFLLSAQVSARGQRIVEQLIDNRQLKQLMNDDKGAFTTLMNGQIALTTALTKLQKRFTVQSKKWLNSDAALMHEFASTVGRITDLLSQLDAFKAQLNDQETANVYWLRQNQYGDSSSLELSGGLLLATGWLRQNVYAHFKQPTFTGATLFTSSRANYLIDQLDLDRQETATKRLAERFDYASQARLFVATDAPAINLNHPDEQIHYWASTIAKLVQTTSRQTLVLFNSLAAVSAVYEALTHGLLPENHTVYAQGVTGSREKNLKRFTTENSAVLLGAASYWEGIDLPKDALELVVITRLPFDAPTDLLVAATNAQLEAKGHNPFYSSALPKATLRLRQGIGRLIRTDNDRGVIVVLDPRLITKRYGGTMQKALPDALPVIPQGTAEIIKQTQNFFK
ncbi:helicase C-terminal domain-containing protein [Furfurilactobacillus cerevisiae]|uniref:helicase C-terminal domain-containing protein n=1 Tax=Furfurilactobacillus rossiae TaxID=231049 RepID=UPI003B9816B8